MATRNLPFVRRRLLVAGTRRSRRPRMGLICTNPTFRTFRARRKRELAPRTPRHETFTPRPDHRRPLPRSHPDHRLRHETARGAWDDGVFSGRATIAVVGAGH